MRWHDAGTMNTKYEIVVYWSEADGCFLAEVPELPKLITTAQPVSKHCVMPKK
jgi:hypothetical protein